MTGRDKNAVGGTMQDDRSVALPAAAPQPAWHAVPRSKPGSDPSGEFLRVREELAHASRARLLTVRCPWCGARPGESCTVVAAGMRLDEPHDARKELLGLGGELTRQQRQAARGQVAASRNSRQAAGLTAGVGSPGTAATTGEPCPEGATR